MRKITLFLFFLSFLPATLIAVPKGVSTGCFVYQQDKINVFYTNNTLYLQGMIGAGKIEIFSIIGNKIAQYEISDLTSAKVSVDLNLGHMYIIRVRYQGNIVKTFKILAS